MADACRVPGPGMDVSVVIPVRNGASVIDGQLAALAGQRTSLRWEVIVADNGSTDRTRAVVESWRPRLAVALVVVDAGRRPGAAYARNRGAEAAAGEVLAFCDCDDQVEADWVEHAVEAVRSHGVVAGLVSPPGRDPLNPEVLTSRTTWRLLGCNFAVRREMFDAVGGFDEDLGPYAAEDAELSLRLQDRGHVIGSAPSMVVNFRLTRSPWVLARKIFNTGRGEVLIQAKRGGPMPTVGATSSSLLGWPIATLTRLRRQRSAGLRSAARDLVLRVGHLVGRLELHRLTQELQVRDGER